jgi:hypothetical protein
LETVVPGEQIDAIAIHEVIDFSRPDEDSASRAVLARYSGQLRIRKGIRDATSMLAHRLIAEMAPNDNFDISRDRNGAPILLLDGRPQDWNLSMAHSGEWILVALARGLCVGVDVEILRPRLRKDDIASMLGWRSSPVDDDDFCSRWTLWEASAKCMSGSVVSPGNDGFDALWGSRPGAVFRSGPWMSFRDKLNNVHYAVVMTAKGLAPTASDGQNAFLAGNG